MQIKRYHLEIIYFVWVDQRDKVCSYKKNIFASLNCYCSMGNSTRKSVNNNEDTITVYRTAQNFDEGKC